MTLSIQFPHRFTRVVRLSHLLVATGFSLAVQADEDIFSLSLAELIELEVVTASRVSEKQLHAPSTIYVVTEDDIRNNAYFTLQDALENIPGLTTISLGHFSFGGQRGFLGNFSKSLIMINGREVQNLIAAETFISHQFASHNIKRIELINGPGSALYGANAFVGVINIITHLEDHSFEGLTLSAEAGDNSTRALSLVAAHNSGRFRIAGSARFYQTENEDYSDFITDTENFSEGSPAIVQSTIAENPAYNNRSWSLPLSLRLDYGDFYAGTEYFRLVGRKGLENVALSFDGIQDEERKFRLGYLGWASTLASGYTLKTEFQNYHEKFWGSNAVYNQERFSELVNAGRDPQAPITEAEINSHFLEFYSQQNSSGSKRNRFDISVQKVYGKDWDMIFGFSYDDLDILGLALSVADPSPPFDETVSDDNPMRKPYFQTRKHSAYLQLKKPLFDERLHTTLGLRADKTDKHGTIETLRMGLSYHLSPVTHVKALYGQAFREPNIFESGAFTQTFVELEPEKIETWELAINHQLFDRVNLNAAGYLNQAHDLIEPGGTSDFDNSGKITNAGLETLLKFELGNWSGDLAYTFSRGQDETVNGVTTNNLNNYRHRVSSAIRYDIQQTLLLNLRLNYFDKLEAEHGNPDIDEIITLPSATRLDFNARFKTLKLSAGELEIIFAVKNLLDTSYYQANVRNGGPKQFLQPGRELMMKCILSL